LNFLLLNNNNNLIYTCKNLSYRNRSIKNKMTLREHEVEVNDTLFPFKISNGIEEFFEKDLELYQTILI
jgi:hypothetical protein